MKFSTSLKILSIISLIQQLKSLKKIEQLCAPQKNINFSAKFNQPDLDSLISKSRVAGQGQFGKVYITQYNSETLGKIIPLAMKEIQVTKDSTPKMMAKEISYLKEFSEIDPERFIKFYFCFYSSRNSQSYVYILTEVLETDLFDVREKISNLPRFERYSIYLDLINDVRDFHKNVLRTYLDKRSYIHLDIKLGNMMVKGDIDSGNFRVKHIDYGLMEYSGEEIALRGTPGYIHPDFYLKASQGIAKAEPKYDVYALIISIAQLEYGYRYGDVSNKCEREFPKKCLDELKMNIYMGFCIKYKRKHNKNEYLSLVEGASNRSEQCLTMICIIYREMTMNLGNMDNIEGLYENMKILLDYEVANSKKILI